MWNFKKSAVTAGVFSIAAICLLSSVSQAHAADGSKPCSGLICRLFNDTPTKIVREPRPIRDGITAVDVRGVVELSIRQGGAPSMIVAADQDRLPSVVTEQDGATLHISVNGNWLKELMHMFSGAHSAVVVELTLPSMQALSLRGSGNTAITGFTDDQIRLASDGSGNIAIDGQYKLVDVALQGSGNFALKGSNDTVNLTTTGSGNIAISGQGKTFNANLTGSGNIEANTFLVDKANISLIGSGNAAIFAHDTASVKSTGSGNFNIYGNPPHHDFSNRGSGEVHWR